MAQPKSIGLALNSANLANLGNAKKQDNFFPQTIDSAREHKLHTPGRDEEDPVAFDGNVDLDEDFESLS